MPLKSMSKRTVKPPGRYLHENIELAIDGNQAEDRKYYSHLIYSDSTQRAEFACHDILCIYI